MDARTADFERRLKSLQKGAMYTLPDGRWVRCHNGTYLLHGHRNGKVYTRRVSRLFLEKVLS